MVADLSQLEIQALRSAVAERADRQGEVPQGVWGELIRRGMVVCAKSEEGLSWFELTDEGCEAWNGLGCQPDYHMTLCWFCDQASPQPDNTALPDCPKCGAYAGDE